MLTITSNAAWPRGGSDAMSRCSNVRARPRPPAREPPARAGGRGGGPPHSGVLAAPPPQARPAAAVGEGPARPGAGEPGGFEFSRELILAQVGGAEALAGALKDGVGQEPQ